MEYAEQQETNLSLEVFSYLISNCIKRKLVMEYAEQQETNLSLKVFSHLNSNCIMQ